MFRLVGTDGGRYYSWSLEAGEFTVVCNEFCGIGHHQMLGKIYVKEN